MSSTLLNSSCSFACHFQSKKQLPPFHIPQKIYNPKITCKSTPNENQNPSAGRRDVLLGLGGMYGVLTGLGKNHSALSAPIQAPDIKECVPVIVECPSDAVNCCPPFNGPIVDFQLPPKPTSLRVRPAAHAVDPEYITKYSEAVKLMKALPPQDPRSFTQQANVHCAYCEGAYHQVGFPKLKLQIHYSWLFLPWHRFYLYFHERILGKLIGDETFALPFWNWDAPSGMEIPAMYTNKASSLYDKLRNAKHQPPFLMNLDWQGCDEPQPIPRSEQIKHNLAVMYKTMISGGKTAEHFMGYPYRAGDDIESNKTPGTLERTPHIPVHNWTGDNTQRHIEDMGAFYSAARDPIFFAHHGNVDRMWYVWKKLGMKHENFTDPDWLNASFLFYDENAQLVRVQVKDCLDNEAMGFTYQDVELPWINSKPEPKNLLRKLDTSFTEPVFPVTVDKIINVTVRRDPKKKKEDEEEVLVIEGIEIIDENKYTKLDVYINAPEFELLAPTASEFAGSHVEIPHKHMNVKEEMKNISTTLKLGITDLLEDLKADHDEKIIVSLVPRSGRVSVRGIKIEFSI